MSTVILSDGTHVPSHYDFNQHFSPLVVKNQGQQGICWWETRCTMLEAFMRMYEFKNVTYDPHQLEHTEEGWSISHWKDSRYDPPRDIGTMTDTGDKLTNLPEYKDLPAKEAIVKALYTNGVLEGGTYAEQSMDRLYLHPRKYPEYNDHFDRFTHIPVLHTLPGDLAAVKKNNWAHSIIYVGYDWQKGILFQNSWGSRLFGMVGRAYNGWDMLEDKVVDTGFIHSWNEFEPNKFKMPAARTA